VDAMVSLICPIHVSLCLFFLNSFLIFLDNMNSMLDVVMLIGVVKLQVLFCVIC
jgi:hypothetical protein